MLRTACLVLTLACSVVEPIAQTLSNGLVATTVTTGLSAPTTMEFVSDTQFLVLEKNTGRVKVVTLGSANITTALDLAVSSNSERGLLGIALDPDFANNRFVYLYYSTPNSGSADTSAEGNWLDNRVVRFTWNGSVLQSPSAPIIAFPAQAVSGAANGPNHDGGIITFGPDGKLYGITGDLNRSRLEQNRVNANFPTAGVGGVFRINADGTIPSDNPFINDSRPEIKRLWSYGVRNSFGLTFDSQTGLLWDTENGPDQYDEINVVHLGFNSGWNLIMGPDNRDPENESQLIHLPNSHYSDPEYSWLTPIAPSAILFLNSAKFSGVIRGNALVADSNNGRMYMFSLNAARDGFVLTGGLADLVADNATERDQALLGTGFQTPTDIKLGPDGYVYVVNLSGGRVTRIGPLASPATISGTVSVANYVGSLAGIPITLQLKTGSQIVDTLQTILAADGSYSVSTPTLGTWRVVVKAGQWLSLNVDSVNINGAVTMNWDFQRNGDADNSNIIDDADLTAIVLDYGTAGGVSGRTDLDGSGEVDDGDLTIAILNFGQAGAV